MQIIKTSVNKTGDVLKLFEHFRSIGVELVKKNGCGFCYYYQNMDSATDRFEHFTQYYGMKTQGY
jgi:hypothetical protein